MIADPDIGGVVMARGKGGVPFITGRILGTRPNGVRGIHPPTLGHGKGAKRDPIEKGERGSPGFLPRTDI